MSLTKPTPGLGKIAIVVLGMHRSGTSAMAGLLAQNGAGLPDNLMAAGVDNPTGFWESADVAELNDQILRSRDSRWDDIFSGVTRPLAEIDDPIRLDQAKSLIERHFHQAPLIVLKDPRISVLSRFWHTVLIEAGYDPRYILMVRHPLEVAQSLTTRNQFSREKGIILWSSYMIAAERGSRNLKRIFVSYDSLLQDWRSVLDRVESELGARLPRRTSKASLEADQFLQTSMRHHTAAPTVALDAIWPPAKALYDWFDAATKGDHGPNLGPDQAFEELAQSSKIFGPILAEADAQVFDLYQSRARLDEALAALNYDLINERSERALLEDIGRELEAMIGHLKHSLTQARHAQAEIEDARLNLAEQLEDKERALSEHARDREHLNQLLTEARRETETALALHAREIEQLDQLLTEARHENDSLRQKSLALTGLEQAHAEQSSALIHLQQSHADLAGRYTAITQSTSWRMTAPVRRWLSRHSGLAKQLRGIARTLYHLVRFRLALQPIPPAALEAERARLKDAGETPHSAEAQGPNWPFGWPLAETPHLSPAVLGLYDRRPDDHIVRACQAGTSFFAQYGLLGDSPNFRGAADSLKARAIGRTKSDSAPDVSIIIPIYGQLAYTLNCLDSLLAHNSRYQFEILIGDDASPDESFQFLSDLPEIQYIKHARNLGFIGNCNSTARSANGRFLVLLNNDTRVADGWLDELIDSFNLFPDAGLIGSKLYYPDASLQEAGGIVWQDGSAWNYGRNDDPNRPAYTYARQVDYVSGAAIALPSDLWNTLGGFDARYSPAYYEDTDLAFRVREQGLEVWMQPLSGVVHYEGITSGTDTQSGVKAYQTTNQQTFLSRWGHALRDHRPNGENPLLERERKVSKRVLIIDVTAPTPNQDAGSVVVVQTIAVFQALGYKVTYLPLDNWLYQPTYLDPLRRSGVECLYSPFELDLDAYLAREAHLFDVVHVFRFEVLRRALPSIQKHASRAKLVFNNQDLHYLRVSRQAEIEGSASLRVEARIIKTAEIKAMNGADVICTLSQQEKMVLDQEPDLKRPVVTIPYMIDLPPNEPDLNSQRNDILFLGGYGHSPNIDAAKWLVTEIWPLVRSHISNARLILAGANPTAEVLALAATDIDVPGRIEDLAPVFAGARVFVAPLRYGAGVKGKIYSAFGYGVPVITTSIGAEGMGLTHNTHALIADDAEAIARAIIQLASDDHAWTSLATAARAFVETHHTPKAGAIVMSRLLDQITKRGVN
jgi:GT2 family glycosyltransferase/glycosyltransferase involved in cell wall biosynthesis